MATRQQEEEACISSSGFLSIWIPWGGQFLM